MASVWYGVGFISWSKADESKSINVRHCTILKTIDEKLERKQSEIRVGM